MDILPRKQKYLDPNVPLIVNTDPSYLNTEPVVSEVTDSFSLITNESLRPASRVSIKPFAGFGSPSAQPPAPESSANQNNVNLNKPKADQAGSKGQQQTGTIVEKPWIRSTANTNSENSDVFS